MSLEDLTNYAPSQTSKINESADSFTDAHPLWTPLHKSLWGKGLASLHLSPQDVRSLTRDEDPLPGVSCYPPDCENP